MMELVVLWAGVALAAAGALSWIQARYPTDRRRIWRMVIDELEEPEILRRLGTGEPRADDNDARRGGLVAAGGLGMALTAAIYLGYFPPGVFIGAIAAYLALILVGLWLERDMTLRGNVAQQGVALFSASAVGMLLLGVQPMQWLFTATVLACFATSVITGLWSLHLRFNGRVRSDR
jgi:TRAP-type C4-dicarboxylate transport system permease large subunit